MGWIQDTGKKEASNVNTFAFSFITLPTIGSFIGVGTSVYAGQTGKSAITVTDNQGNIYTKDVERSDGIFTGAALNRCVTQTSSGTFTVTLATATTAGNYYVAGAAEFNQVSPLLLDHTTSNVTVSGTTGTTGATLIARKAQSLVLTCIVVNANDSNLNMTVATNFTIISAEQDAAAVIGHMFAYKLSPIADTFAATYVWDTSAATQQVLANYYMNFPSLPMLGVGV
jgi:hypothetical protein